MLSPCCRHGEGERERTETTENDELREAAFPSVPFVSFVLFGHSPSCLTSTCSLTSFPGSLWEERSP